MDTLLIVDLMDEGDPYLLVMIFLYILLRYICYNKKGVEININTKLVYKIIIPSIMTGVPLTQ